MNRNFVNLKSYIAISILFVLMLLNHSLCIGQIDFKQEVYNDFCEINQKVGFGEFGCNYKIDHKIGSDKRIKESIIKIPNLGALKIKIDYNELGDIVFEEFSFDSRKIEIRNRYNYDTIISERNNVTAYYIINQTTFIDTLEPIVIFSLHGNNSYESLNKQLGDLKRKKDQAIFNLIKESPKTKMYNLLACNCKDDIEMEIVDQVYDYKLLKINDRDGVTIGAGRRNGILYYERDSKDKNRTLTKVIFNYSNTNYVTDRYLYKECDK
jgi:hypothetical protein